MGYLLACSMSAQAKEIPQLNLFWPTLPAPFCGLSQCAAVARPLHFVSWCFIHHDKLGEIDPCGILRFWWGVSFKLLWFPDAHPTCRVWHRKPHGAPAERSKQLTTLSLSHSLSLTLSFLSIQLGPLSVNACTDGRLMALGSV